MSTRRAAWTASVAALLACAVAACSSPSASSVERASRRTPHSVGNAAVRAAEAAASAMTSASVRPTGSPAAEIDPAPFLGRPLKRAPFATRKVALTLDDGPSRNTAEVLSIFERLNARCTFFFVGGRVRGYRSVAKQAYETGFEIGNHTWDHQEIHETPLAFDLKEIDRCQAELVEVTGHEAVFVRPPTGHWDDATLRATGERGMVLALWSLHGQDTGPGTHARTITSGVLRSARGGDVILLHETNPETVKALPAIIEGLRAKGLEPVTLSELLTR